MEKKAIISPGRESSYSHWHFSPAMVSGDFVFVSGCIGSRADGSTSDDPAEQFRLAFEHVGTTLEHAAIGFDAVVEMTTYHVGLQRHLDVFRQVKDDFIGEPYPAWTAIGITELAIPGALVEIRVTARRSGD